jgi:hypothetical protein
MPFTGKATFTSGSTLPETAEDVADIIGIISPFETPLLDHLGDARRVASSTRHEWLEDALLPNTDTIDPDHEFTVPESDSVFAVSNGDRFRVGDQVQPAGSAEVMFVTGVASNTLTVARGYGGTTPEALAAGQLLTILGNAALEGDDAPAARFTSRLRRSNYTQIFTASVEVSGTALAVRQIGLDDEMDYQKQERLRELTRDLENCVINGRAPLTNPQGDSATRRTMKGILGFVASNIFAPGVDGFPSGGNLSEEQLNTALRTVWGGSAGNIDTLVVNGLQKRRINNFLASNRRFAAGETRFRDLVGLYESDFGVCRVVLSRWMPADSVLLLDSSRIHVLPLAGRSFHFKRFSSSGDREAGQLIGEYTLELHNENAHGVIRGLSTS